MRTDITAEFFENELGFAKQKAQSIYEKIKDNTSHMVRALLSLKKETMLKKLEFFKKELGYSFETTLEHPGLLTMDCFESEDNPNSLRAKIKFFKNDMGFSQTSFNQIPIAIFSNDLSITKEKINYLKQRIGFLPKHIQQAPTILGIGIEKLESKIKFFEDELDFSSAQFQRSPKLLTFDTDSDSPVSLKNKIKFYREELGFSNQQFKIAPGIFTLDTVSDESNPSSVRSKIKFYRTTLGFDNRCFQNAPFVLSFDVNSSENSPTSIRAKIKFYKERLGFDNRQFQMMPSILASDTSDNPSSPTSVLSKVKFYETEIGILPHHIKQNPALLKYDCTSDESVSTSIKSKLAKLREVGITNEDIQNNTKLLAIPAEDVKDKYVLWSVMFPDRSFMQKQNWSVTRSEKIYARFMFLKEKKQLSFHNVSTSENRFFKYFKIHSETLMSQYPLDDMAYQQIYALYYLLELEPPLQHTQQQKEQ